MTSIIEIAGLTKRYGDLTALNALTLSVDEGAVVGFVGPNGAGKTTTMRILTTLLRPTAGDAIVAGYSVVEQPREVRRAIGYMPDFFGVYEDMRVWEYLDFFAACYDIAPAVREPMIGDLLELVDLGHKRDAYVDSLSRGMKQRLCLARTLAHDPQVLILDEPASGLDPRARIEMRELLRELRLMGKTIFFSSHILSEVADVCTHLAILEAGNLIAYGGIDEMKKRLRAHRLIEVRVLGDVAELEAFLQQSPAIEAILKEDADGAPLPPDVVRFDFVGDDDALSGLLAAMVQADIRLVSFNEDVGDLEDVFLQATRGLVQ